MSQQRDGSDQSSFLSDLRSLPEKGDDDRNLQDDRKQSGREEINKKDRECATDVGMDLIEERGDGCLILGNKRITGRSTVMIIPGFNERCLIEMGDLGLLKGKAKRMYEKLKKLEGG